MITNRRQFLAGLAGLTAVSGCKSAPWWFGETPQLRLGVISDLHITTPESTEEFRRALVYYRDRGADAIIVDGDLSDWGLKSGLQYVMNTWKDVFPNDRAPDGRPVARLFCTGNHDLDGWWYGDMTLDMHIQGYAETKDDALSKYGMKKGWEEVFGEPWSFIRKRTVKGFDFVSVEWPGDGKFGNDKTVVAWLKEHAAELKGDKPFFFFRHMPLPCTVVESNCEGKNALLTDALRAFPNCIAFNGHTHWTFNDERSIWQDEFTAISIPSMSYSSIPSGYENGFDDRTGKAKASMPKLPARENLEEAEGYFISLYADRMNIERYDFENDCEGAAPWVVPLGANRPKPYTFKAHSAALPVPQFPEGAEVSTHVVNAETRSGRWTIYMAIDFPAAKTDGVRTYDYEIRAEMEKDGSVAAKKLYLSPAFYKLERDEPEAMHVRFDMIDAPETGKYRFKIYPRNCFGIAGRPIASRVFESKPGKAKPNRG